METSRAAVSASGVVSNLMGFPFVPPTCQVHLDWAVTTGKNFDPPLADYSKMKSIAGVDLQEATIDDFQLLFKCEGIQMNDCNLAGLELPSTCSNPPCECTSVPPPPKTPSIVRYEGHNLFVDDELFHINGVCWSPVPVGSAFGGELYKEYSDIDVPKMAEAGMNALRTYRPILDLSILDKLFEHGIRVMVPIMPNSATTTEEDIAYVVNMLKDHPAVLMWSLGNEWNLNTFYNPGLSVDDCVEWIRMASSVIKKLDKNHPIATVYGDASPAVESMVPRLPDVDVWAMNVYRFDSFRDLFTKWDQVGINKPLILGEFGVDAWDSSSEAGGQFNAGSNLVTGGKYRPDIQADVTDKLMKEIYEASTKTPGDVKVTSGGFIFAWSDEYWKRGGGSIFSQESEGLSPCWPNGCGPAPDRTWNEEYWGLAGISRDYSQCGPSFNAESSCPLREAYYKYKDAPKP